MVVILRSRVEELDVVDRSAQRAKANGLERVPERSGSHVPLIERRAGFQLIHYQDFFEGSCRHEARRRIDGQVVPKVGHISGRMVFVDTEFQLGVEFFDEKKHYLTSFQK